MVFGRLLQTRTQAEDVLFDDVSLPADQAAPSGNAVGRARNAADPQNIVVSGWQVMTTGARSREG
jgi:hypothetical protein